MINELIKLANHFDDNGDYRQANYLDEMIKKNAQHATAARIAEWLKIAGKRTAPWVRIGFNVWFWAEALDWMSGSDTASDNDCGNCSWPFMFFKAGYKEFYDYHNEYGYPKKLNNILNNPKWHREVIGEHNILWIGGGDIPDHVPGAQLHGKRGEHWIQDPRLDDNWKPCCIPRWRPSSQTAAELEKEIIKYFDSTEYKTLIAFWDCYNDPGCRGPNVEGVGGDYREENIDLDIDADTDTDTDDGSDSDTDTSIDTDFYVEPTGGIEGDDSLYMNPEDYDYYTNDFNFYRGGDMINELVKLATHLDNKDHYREANYIDEMIRKEAAWPAFLPVLRTIAVLLGWEVVTWGGEKIFKEPDHLKGMCEACVWPYLALAKFLMDDSPSLKEIHKLDFLQYANYYDQKEFAMQIVRSGKGGSMPEGLRRILDDPMHKEGYPDSNTELAKVQQRRHGRVQKTSCCTPGWLPNMKMNDALWTMLTSWVETGLQKELDAEEQTRIDLQNSPWNVDQCRSGSCHKPSDDYTPFDQDVRDWQEMVEPVDQSSKDDLTRWLDEYSKSSTEEGSSQASPGSSSDQYYYGQGGQYPTR